MRFQCPECKGIVAAENSDMGALVQCGHCDKQISVPNSRTSSGSVIGDFVILHELGRGGMGIVYQAHQISLDRPAALKILTDSYASNAEFVIGFIKEARAAAKLNHPNIVQAYAVGDDEGIFYFAMEHVDGETMKEVLNRRNVLPYMEAAGIIQQIAEALDYAWKEEKLVHRDIKPDNIMLTSSGRAKLADLGLAKVGDESDGSTDSDEVMGTPQYISPEQLTGDPLDNRTDIYSLGATFYQFLTGRFPYEGANAIEITRQHLFGTLIPVNQVNPEVPETISRVVDKMMAKDPKMRYQSAGELAEDLALIKRGLDPQSATAAGSIVVQRSNQTEINNRPVPPKLRLKGVAAQTNNKNQGTETVREVQPKTTVLKLSLSKSNAAPQLAVPKPVETPKQEPQKPKLTLLKPEPEPTIPVSSKPSLLQKQETSLENPPKTEGQAAPRKKPSLALKKEEKNETQPPSQSTDPADDQAVQQDSVLQDQQTEMETKKGRKFPIGKVIIILAVLLVLTGAGTFSYFMFIKKNISIKQIQNSANDILAKVHKEPSEFFKNAEPLVRKIQLEGTTNQKNVMAECFTFFSRNLIPENEEEKKLLDIIVEYFTPVDEDKIEPLRQQKITDYEKTLKRQMIQAAAAAERRQEAERIRDLDTKKRQIREDAARARQKDEAAQRNAERARINAENAKKQYAVNSYKNQLAVQEKNLYFDMIQYGSSNDIAGFRGLLERYINEPAPDKTWKVYAKSLVTKSEALLDTLEKGWIWDKYLTDGIPQLNGKLFSYNGYLQEITGLKNGEIQLKYDGETKLIKVSILLSQTKKQGKKNKSKFCQLLIDVACEMDQAKTFKTNQTEGLAYYFFWRNDFKHANNARKSISDKTAKQRFSQFAANFIKEMEKTPQGRGMLSDAIKEYPEYLAIHPSYRPKVRSAPKKQPVKKSAPQKTQSKKK